MTAATPFFGIPPYVLGMTRDAVRAAAGEPESVETTQDDEGSSVESWFYAGGAIELEFDAAADARLESVTAWSADITINGVALVGAELAALPGLAAQAGIADLELTEDFGDSGKCWQSESRGLMVWVAKGKVVNLTIFPRFDEQGERPQWPE